MKKIEELEKELKLIWNFFGDLKLFAQEEVGWVSFSYEQIKHILPISEKIKKLIEEIKNESRAYY